MSKDPSTMPHGFILSESAIYSFLDQDVFPDIISFSAAIPDHLKPLFLIPIRLDPVAPESRMASRIADGFVPDGQSLEADLFGYKSFVYDDNEPTVPSSEPGSIFEIDGPDAMTHHQDDVENQDVNVQVPSDTSYMSDVDITDSDMSYPYRTNERPLRHSTVLVASFFGLRFALKPEQLETKAPGKIKENARSCNVSMVSYDKRGRVFTFDVNCGNGAKTVRAALTDVDHVAMSCTCPFWRWNGPEFHANQEGYMLGVPRGTAGPPDVRDPDRKYFLCKHAFAVLRRLDQFVSQVVDENWDLDEDEIMEEVDKDWEDMQAVAEVPIDDFEEEEAPVDWEEPGDGEIQDAETDDMDASEIVPEDEEESDPEESSDENSDDEEDEDEYPDIEAGPAEPEEPEEPEVDEDEAEEAEEAEEESEEDVPEKGKKPPAKPGKPPASEEPEEE